MARRKYATKSYSQILTYLVLMNTAIVLSTVLLHEFGHVVAGEQFGCTNIKLVMYDSETSDTFTQMSCPENAPVAPIALAGFLFAVPFALLFVLIKDFPEKYFSLVILGFNFVISTSDILSITGVPVYQAILIVAGGAIVIIGESLIIDKLIYTGKQR